MKHYYNDTLKPIKRKIKVYKIASYDIETYGKYNKFLLGGFINTQGKYKSFTDNQEMIKYIEENTDSTTLIYATNNMFDYQALFSEQYDYTQYSPLLRGGRIIQGNYRGMKFLDTLSYIGVGVKELGAMLGLPKGKLDMTHNKKGMTKREMRTLREYNRRDCQITREFMIQFQKVLNDLGGELKITIGSCAMDLYRRKYLKQNIHKEYHKTFNDGERVKDFIFRGYHGGRTEMFKRGESKDWRHYHRKKEQYYLLDFNSMYADVMRLEYPIPSSSRIEESINGDVSIDYIKKYHGISECEVIHPNIYYPVLPHVINNKLCFPIGKFKGVFMHGELQKFLLIGGKITKIFKTIYYKKTFKPFKNWVEDLYALRLKYKINGNEVYVTIIKNLLVNLYGKFGTNKLKEFEMLDIRQNSELELDDLLDAIPMDDKGEILYKETAIESNQSYIQPIFACEVTMNGRLKLYDKMVELSAIYVDTDSCFTNKYMESSYNLGDMKLEMVCDSTNFVKPKHYKYLIAETGKYIYKIKGLRLSKNDDLRLRDIERKRQFEKSIKNIPIRQMKFLKMKEVLRGQGSPNEKIMFTKRINVIDNKRDWIKPYSKWDFQDSKPILLGFDNIDDLEKLFNNSSI